MGHGIGSVLITLNNGYIPFTARLCFDYTNNMAEYEACYHGSQSCYRPKDQNSGGVQRLNAHYLSSKR